MLPCVLRGFGRTAPGLSGVSRILQLQSPYPPSWKSGIAQNRQMTTLIPGNFYSTIKLAIALLSLWHKTLKKQPPGAHRINIQTSTLFVHLHWLPHYSGVADTSPSRWTIFTIYVESLPAPCLSLDCRWRSWKEFCSQRHQQYVGDNLDLSNLYPIVSMIHWNTFVGTLMLTTKGGSWTKMTGTVLTPFVLSLNEINTNG